MCVRYLSAVGESLPFDDLSVTHRINVGDTRVNVCASVTDSGRMTASHDDGVPVRHEGFRHYLPSRDGVANGLEKLKYLAFAGMRAGIGNGCRTMIDPLGVIGYAIQYRLHITSCEGVVYFPNEREIFLLLHSPLPSMTILFISGTNQRLTD